MNSMNSMTDEKPSSFPGTHTTYLSINYNMFRIQQKNYKTQNRARKKLPTVKNLSNQND